MHQWGGPSTRLPLDPYRSTRARNRRRRNHRCRCRCFRRRTIQARSQLWFSRKSLEVGDRRADRHEGDIRRREDRKDLLHSDRNNDDDHHPARTDLHPHGRRMANRVFPDQSQDTAISHPHPPPAPPTTTNPSPRTPHPTQRAAPPPHLCKNIPTNPSRKSSPNPPGAAAHRARLKARNPRGTHPLTRPRNPQFPTAPPVPAARRARHPRARPQHPLHPAHAVAPPRSRPSTPTRGTGRPRRASRVRTSARRRTRTRRLSSRACIRTRGTRGGPRSRLRWIMAAGSPARKAATAGRMGGSIPASMPLEGIHARWTTRPRPHGSGGAARQPGNGKVGAGAGEVEVGAGAEARVAGPKCKRKQTTRRCFQKVEIRNTSEILFNTCTLAVTLARCTPNIPIFMDGGRGTREREGRDCGVWEASGWGGEGGIVGFMRRPHTARNETKLKRTQRNKGRKGPEFSGYFGYFGYLTPKSIHIPGAGSGTEIIESGEKCMRLACSQPLYAGEMQ